MAKTTISYETYAPRQTEADTRVEEEEDDIKLHLFKKHRVGHKNDLETYLAAELADPDNDVVRWWMVDFLLLSEAG